MDNQVTIKSNITAIFNKMKKQWPDEISTGITYFESCESNSMTVNMGDWITRNFSTTKLDEIETMLKELDKQCKVTREALCPRFNVRKDVADRGRQIACAIMVGHLLATTGELVRVWEWWKIQETDVTKYNARASSQSKTSIRELRHAREDFFTVADMITEETTFKDFVELGCDRTPESLFNSMKRSLLNKRAREND